MNRTFPQHLATKAGAALITELDSITNLDHSLTNLDQRVTDVIRGFKAGMDRAQSLKPGDRFQGAVIEADAYAGVGQSQNSAAWQGFIIGFASSLPELVVTNTDDVLLEYR